MKKVVITIPGFQFAGVHCGIKDSPRKKDLSLIYSEGPKTLVDGVFTTNRVCAPPVDLCRKVVRAGFSQLVVVNSGVANACTGSRGMKDALQTQREAARLFGLKASTVCVSSTGKIGDYLPMHQILSGLKKARGSLGPQNFSEAVQGIMTTDLFPKFGVIHGRIFGRRYTMAVLAKGAGMLCPNMATLLSYIVTDLKMTRSSLRSIFRSSVNQTLNRVTVDGDTSTNDTVLMMANGRAGNRSFKASSPEGRMIQRKLTHLLETMARQIALDGEGATKCCDVVVRGARNQGDAKKIAYAIGNSPLVKTALFGCDPNWGRIVAAVGYSGARIDPHRIDVQIGPYWVARQGRGTLYHTRPGVVSRYMRKKNMRILVQCGRGPGGYHVYMSDLTYDYVNLNAEYRT